MLNQFQLFNQLLAITACLLIQQCLLVLQNMGQVWIVHIQRPSIINYKSFIIEFLSEILPKGTDRTVSEVLYIPDLQL